MDIFLLILGLVIMLVGIAGSFLPIVPGGPFTSWFGFVAFYFIKGVPTEYIFLTVTLLIGIAVLILDYIVPALGAKKFGGSNYGAIGATMGLLVGLFFPPFGILLGPFIGAFLGEIIKNNNTKNAFKAAIGSFLGFLASTFMKFFVSFIYLGLFTWKVIQHWDVIF